MNARQEMSVFLERQTVRRHQVWTRRLRHVERALLSMAIVLVGLVALFFLYQMVFMGQTFRIKKIVVEGKWQFLTAEGLGRLSGVNEDDNLFWINVDGIYEKLKTEPWVKAVAVRRELPDTLWIYAEEHKPCALLINAEGIFYVDEEGEIFKKVEAGDDKSFPVLTGFGTSSGKERIEEALSLIEKFSASKFGMGREVAGVHFDPVKGYSLITKREPVQILFGHAFLAEKVEELDRFTPAIGARPGRIQYMLVNEPKRVIVKYQTS